MAVRLIEGWESSTAAADYLGKWTSLAATSIGTAGGRNGNGLRLQAGNTGGQRTLDAQATWVLGFAFRTSAAPTANTAICAFLDSATTHCGVALDTSGTLYGWRTNTSTVLGFGSLTLSPTTWYYLEVKATIGDAPGGVLVVKANGTTVLNLTTADTRNAGNASANIVRLGATTAISGAILDYDDVYVLDTTGSTNTDFLGDCKVERVLPTGAGATTAWTPSAGSNYQCVDEADANEDTDYVSSSTAAQTDTYAFGDLAVTGAVLAVQATAQARKDDAGSRSLALVARPGSTDRVGSTQSVLDTYTMLPQVWDTNPDTSAAWTVAELNASQFGCRLVA